MPAAPTFGVTGPAFTIAPAAPASTSTAMPAAKVILTARIVTGRPPLGRHGEATRRMLPPDALAAHPAPGGGRDARGGDSRRMERDLQVGARGRPRPDDPRERGGRGARRDPGVDARPGRGRDAREAALVLAREGEGAAPVHDVPPRVPVRLLRREEGIPAA